MKHLVCLMALIGLGCLQMRAAEDQEVTLRLIETSDVHGCYFPSNPQLSSSASFLRLNVLSSLN